MALQGPARWRPTGGVSPRAAAEIFVWRHGWAGPLAMALFMAALGVWQFHLVPLRETINRQALSMATAKQAVSPSTVNTDANAERLAQFIGALGPENESIAALSRLVALTRNELLWQQAEFTQTREASIGVARLQITVPVSGQYRSLRESTERALLEMPNLSLDQIIFRREQATQSQVDARLKLSLWLRLSVAGQRAAVSSTGASR